MSTAVCAHRSKRSRRDALFLALLGAAGTGLGLWWVVAGGLLEKTLGVLLFVYSFSCLFCAYHALSAHRPERYCLQNGTLVFGAATVALHEIRAAWLEPRSLCPLALGELAELSLVLKTKDGREIVLPLSYEGWEAVYEALRKERPELLLPPWWKNPLIHSELARPRAKLAPPAGCKVEVENTVLGLLVAFFALWIAALLLALFPSPPNIDAIKVIVPLGVAYFAYRQVVQPRVRCPE